MPDINVTIPTSIDNDELQQQWAAFACDLLRVLAGTEARDISVYPHLYDYAGVGHKHRLIAWHDADGTPRSIVIR